MDFLNEWYRNNITGKDGKYQGRGWGAAILKPFVDEESIEQEVQTQRNTETANSLGFDIGELDLAPGASTLDVQGAAIRQGKQDKKDAADKAHAQSLDATKLQIQANREARDEDRKIQLMQLVDTRDQRIAQLEYQKSRDRKADMQYNERMEQLDRKDRRTAMSTIAAGLASLGAAFAM